MEHYIEVLSDRSSVLIAIIIIPTTIFIVSHLLSSGAAQFPLLGGELGNSEKRRKAFFAGAAALYDQGYAAFRDKPFRLTTVDGERIVVPTSALDELRRLPDETISNKEALNKTVENRYTGLHADNKLLNHIIRADLTRNLSRLNPRLGEEVARTVDEVLGPCEDWTRVTIHQKFLRIVAIVSGQIFLGPELCRKEEYLYASINYTVDVFAAIRKLKAWHHLLRPVAQYFIPEIKTLNEHRIKAREFLLPIIKERKAAAAAGQELPDDMLQWMINKADEFQFSDQELADTQLTLSLAAIHTTSATATDILSELVVRPEVVEELRGEIKEVLQRHDGVIHTQTLFEMKLLDSVMREAQRVSPFNQARFSRYVSKPVTLSNGIHLPAGYTIESPHGPVMRDTAIYPDADKFDAHRFADLRAARVPDPVNYKSREQYQFVSVTKENMSFGFGAHACPGRFFAANEIKLILSRLLLQYDLRLPEGTQIPPRLIAGAQSQANPKLQIELRKVQTA
ncbi:hypothetical protein PFICI_10050 [Pestalotiopsis fici W106-1]|uniref:Ent-kaurene oxidase n=1 Tax=Pestalotiopsis fici (strain W106-1 / CGMCC3.15140) TaxID=1229662 RepID=W3WVT8_PESFW|nr:uncharacterized protein PFICI_10050 [Pestalotiopsis fici W106-1]ETS77988.1 hypothetical protein PFICI_10050 [Pestalotiopsis fici W106-1]